MGIAVLIGASVALQVAAGFLALRLVRLTGASTSWILIACGLWGMAARRVLSLLRALHVSSSSVNDLYFEELGLATSVAMLAGVSLIGPIFREVKSARERAEQIAEEKEGLAKSLQEAMSNLKILSGLLPICAGCKSIRDEGGEWHSLESYVTDRTDAEFTHGLCPDCRALLYPGLGAEERQGPR